MMLQNFRQQLYLIQTSQRRILVLSDIASLAKRECCIWDVSTVGTKSWNRTLSSLVERIGQALPHRIKKQFQEKNLSEKVVISAFTSQTGKNQRLSPATSNVLVSEYKCAFCCSWFIPRSLEVLALLWSYSRSPGRFPSGRSHHPGRHVQVQAEHAKCL